MAGPPGRATPACSPRRTPRRFLLLSGPGVAGGPGAALGAGWGGGLADDQLGRELDAPGGDGLALDQVAEHGGGGVTHLGQGLAHGGQRGRDPSGYRQVVETDDAEVL